jgi:hypothetical protein
MNKSELRAVILDILFKKEPVQYSPNQYASLLAGAKEVLKRNGLEAGAEDSILEIFWDLFREGIITLGNNSSNPEFPWFRLHSTMTGKERNEVS